MLKLGRVTKFKMLFLVLVFVFNFDLFKFSAAILEKGLFTHGCRTSNVIKVSAPANFQHFLSSSKSISSKFRSCNMHIYFSFLIKPSDSRKKSALKLLNLPEVQREILTSVSMERDRRGQWKRNLTLVFTGLPCVKWG